MVRTRFAPSPTGYLHIGGLRTAIYNYLIAKKTGGDYILRIEDTDQTRYVPGSVENLVTVLGKCHIQHAEGPMVDENGEIYEVGPYGSYYQSKRLEIYAKYAKQLIDEGKAYYCFCSQERLQALREEQSAKGLTPKYDSKCSHLSKEEVEARLAAGESHVVRMKLPENEDITFEDGVRGTVTINTKDIDEQVLMKADGFPTYHFAVVVDDRHMKITHVIRGEEWLVSTPKHILLYRYFGWEAPSFVHLPTVLNKNKKKLSKRDGSAAVEDFLVKGYLPEAIINYITMLGWSMPDGKEIFSLEEAAAEFDLSRLSKAGAVFDIDKLNWINSHYIKEMADEELSALVKKYLVGKYDELANDETKLLYFTSCIKDRVSYLEEVIREAEEIFGEVKEVTSEEGLEAKAMQTNPQLYSALVELIEKEETLTPDVMKAIFKTIQKEYKIKGKALYMPTRIALTGEVHGADIQLIMCILGKDEVLRRIKSAM